MLLYIFTFTNLYPANSNKKLSEEEMQCAVHVKNESKLTEKKISLFLCRIERIMFRASWNIGQITLSLTYDVDIDGTYFGTTFPHLFLMTYPHLKPQKPSQQYIPRVFGFKIHKPEW